jgi:hypothetical protein
MLTLLLSPLLSLLIGTAHAEPYFVAGAGKAQLNQHNVNGHWVQLGYDHEIDQTTNTFRIGAGWQAGSWLDFEVDYRDLGEFNSMIRFVSDKNYNQKTHGCKKPCEPTRAAWLHGETVGIAASAVIAPDWDVAPLLRLGVMHHWSDFMAHYVGTGRSIKRLNRDQGGSLSDTGFNYLLGVGVRADNLDFEVTYYPKVAAGGSAYQDAYAFTVSWRF